MGYMHIDNLYKSQDILEFRRVYALEKIHGTSANVAWRKGDLRFFSGGEKHANFITLFDATTLEAKFRERFTDESSEVVVYGEAYGGKCQHMSKTYGPSLKFVAFDVKIGDKFLSVPNAHGFVTEYLGLEFVDFALVSTDLVALDAERDKPSTQAKRNGIEGEQLREGVVLRPVQEWTDHRGNRAIVKHKRAEFAERGRPKVELDPSRREMLEGAEDIALEWVTQMRLEHVIDHILASRVEKDIEMRDIPAIVAGMVEDVTREAAGQIVDNQPARKAIGTRAVQLFKERIQRILV